MPVPENPTIRLRIPIIHSGAEQLPWTFEPSDFEVVRQPMATGDYSIRGLSDQIIVERKSLGDLVSTVIHDWIRFRKELNRLAGCTLGCIVVEANVEDVLQHKFESEANPLSVMGRVHEIFLDHGIPVFFWGNRVQCVANVSQMFRMAWKRWGNFA